MVGFDETFLVGTRSFIRGCIFSPNIFRLYLEHKCATDHFSLRIAFYLMRGCVGCLSAQRKILSENIAIKNSYEAVRVRSLSWSIVTIKAAAHW